MQIQYTIVVEFPGLFFECGPEPWDSFLFYHRMPFCNVSYLHCGFVPLFTWQHHEDSSALRLPLFFFDSQVPCADYFKVDSLPRVFHLPFHQSLSFPSAFVVIFANLALSIFLYHWTVFYGIFFFIRLSDSVLEG